MPIVNTGPSEPTSDALLAPMRRIASAISHVGSTVENTAIASDSAWIERRHARARRAARGQRELREHERRRHQHRPAR